MGHHKPVQSRLDESTDLRYVEAHSVRCPGGSLSDFRVCTADAQSLGSVDGVLISPAARRLEYFVVGRPGLFRHRRYLVSVDAGAVVHEEPKTLRISARKDELELQAFAPDSVREFSDDDLVKAMFSQSAA